MSYTIKDNDAYTNEGLERVENDIDFSMEISYLDKIIHLQLSYEEYNYLIQQMAASGELILLSGNDKKCLFINKRHITFVEVTCVNVEKVEKLQKIEIEKRKENCEKSTHGSRG